MKVSSECEGQVGHLKDYNEECDGFIGEKWEKLLRKLRSNVWDFLSDINSWHLFSINMNTNVLIHILHYY